VHPSQLFDELRKRNGFSSDSEVAKLLGLTSARVSQMRTGKHILTARQLASYLEKSHELGYKEAFVQPISPIVEMYPIQAVLSKQDAKWEPLPTTKSHPRNQSIRKHLEESKGIYVFFDSLGCAIYVGKTEKQNIWKEMTNAFNRERSNHQTFVVAHPTTGTTFSPAWEKPRQPQKRVAYLYNTATYFSAYDVAAGLTPTLEALLVRVFCNSLSNKKMEKF
jgi:transcriptional regulator with XRE-family HTH domain